MSAAPVDHDPVAPLRKLIGSVVARTAALAASVRGTEPPARRTRWDPAAYRRRWDTAVRCHQELTGAAGHDARKAVTSMVQQASWLAESVPGFADDPGLLVRAIDEIIRVGTGWEVEGVTSVDAQRLWYAAEAGEPAARRRRRARTGLIRRASDLQARLNLQAACAEAWQAWAGQRMAGREREGG